MKSRISSISLVLLFTSNFFLMAQEDQAPAETPSTSVNEILPYTVDKSELYLKDDMLFSTNFYGSHRTDKAVLNGTTTSETDFFHVDGTIQWGYFIFDRFAIGLGVNTGVDYTHFSDGNEDTTVDLFGGPFIRFYLVDKIYINILGGYGISNNKFEAGTTVINTNYNGLYAVGGLGYDIFLNSTKDIALEIGANYVYKQLVNTQDNTDEIISGGMNYNIGLIFYFF